MLARLWPQDNRTVWQRRATAPPIGASDLIWDILEGPAPVIGQPVSAVIVLAGVTRGDGLHLNTGLAQAGCNLAQRLGVRAVVASSQAVYGRAAGRLSETDVAVPATPYGQAKHEMEQAISHLPDVTCLRIGNVAGADGMFSAMAQGPVRLDQFADGRAPQRMMIGPRDLAAVLVGLCQTQQPLPKILNTARPNLIGMDDLAQATGVQWSWQPAPDTALPELAMDVSALMDIVPLPPTTATDLMVQARDGGWQVAR